MKNYTIAYTATDDDIKSMLALDHSAYHGKDAGEFHRCKEWLSVNKDIYTILKLDGKVIGYINFVPLKEEVYTAFCQGHYKDFELKAQDILPFEAGKEHKCLFMSIVIDKKYRDGEALFLLLTSLRKRIRQWHKEGAYITHIITDCVSKEGVKLASRILGADFIQNSKGGKIYACNLTQSKGWLK